MSHLIDVTPFGARLRLKRPTEIGRLLLLTMVMPRQLRCFDHTEDQYRVWSLVRNLRPLDAATHKGAVIEIGVAFVGKRPPTSFLTDPSTRYDIANRQAGMWTVQEESEKVLSDVDPADKRKEWRHTIPIEMTIEVFGGEREAPQFENTVTENISAGGAAVFTALNLDRGRFVKLRTREGAEIMAVVRRRIVGADGIARLHLQFIGYEWPL